MGSTNPRTNGPTGHYTVPVRSTKSQVCLVLADPTTRVQTAHPSGLVAQLVEHPLCKRGASGSNPDESMGKIPILDLERESANLQPT